MALRGLPVDVLSADQVAVLFGRGSMLHSAFVALKANNRFFKATAIPLADDEAGAAATEPPWVCRRLQLQSRMEPS